MTEVGSVLLARVALRVGEAARPAHRSTCAKRRFIQLPLLAIVCLMRDADWTFRKADVRLTEPGALRAKALTEVVHQFPLPSGGNRATVAINATGLAAGTTSTVFVKRAKDRAKGFAWRHWLTWTIAIALGSRLVVAHTARRKPYHDGATLRPSVDASNPRVTVGLMLPDAECESARHHQYLRHLIGAARVLPAKSGKATWRIAGLRAAIA
jgi:hypothetical protein